MARTAAHGIVTDSPPLADQWPSKGLKKLWDSEAIPSDEDGGHGSVVAAGGRVYASLVWHTDVPTETRAIDYLVMTSLVTWRSAVGPRRRWRAWRRSGSRSIRI